MNRTKYQRFPDGTRVRFTDEAREAMRKRPGTTRPLRMPAGGSDAVYIADNTDDSLHDVILRETGERYGLYWLEAAPTYNEAAKHYLRTGELDSILCLDAVDRKEPTTETEILEEFFDRQLPMTFDPKRTVERPTIVCLCGSTKFRAEMTETNHRLTLSGSIVLAPGVFAHDGDEITEEQKRNLDELHLRKIDMADEVLIVDPGGYVGESTAREIAYARVQHKPLYFLSTMQPLEESDQP